MMINKKLDTTYLKPSDKNYEKVPNVLELKNVTIKLLLPVSSPMSPPSLKMV